MHIAFLAYRVARDRLTSTEFYRQDIEILKSLGHRVTVATSLRELPRDADIVFLWWWNWLWLVGPVIKMRGTPICVTGSLEPDIYEQRSWVYRFLVRNGMRFADRSVFVSRYMIERLSELMPLKDPLLCPHIVMDEYRLATPQNTRTEQSVIFNVAWKKLRNTHRKMLPELIEAFAIVQQTRPDSRLVLAGEPMDGEGPLRRRAEELGIANQVEFLGKISKEEKISWMQRCGAYYQCSRHEGFGLAIAEAMACGAPVVVNRKTAIPEVVGPHGYYVQNESPESIALSLLEALDNAEDSRELGLLASRRIDSEFRFERRQKFLGELLDNMLSTLPKRNTRREWSADAA
ncbi:GDP-mannose-dependent alpha-(1-6)-phosphatidylinositol monomannoside mannosyltransferase [Pseudobythopirellula maris]|uniref:GDP-mannose-dependent alpha-(1-6)-phosphatidylinositol monomannoside mannosyltransferase n=1 Tax=Pseudobythopirellula maris TaxID=2527991 RepID=A0A5C5ZKY5_9BACT|nr:glycosyltransferase family 4 protein [Pseudobythopirellula maris]TWT87093.1 GDP-mannose-dependent alpha-(1-6)-phosphatidylinositol monomannoside mannosyltransferase [Pseudobythopirellula maris]